jgi:hypothetical protein
VWLADLHYFYVNKRGEQMTNIPHTHTEDKNNFCMACWVWTGSKPERGEQVDTNQEPIDLDTVTQDETPAVVHITQEKAVANCGTCGKALSMDATCWLWQGQAFCDSRKCKPRKLG